ncbi:MAG: NAD(P)/FAD-dependent oxidoreductase [Sphingomicrobium sp.]
MTKPERRLDIAIIGSGISGLSAAWLLSKRHRVTLFEADHRVGGHSHTVEALGIPVDTGFIVYNERTYPNLTALFDHLDVPTKASKMSFSVSLDEGRLEYAGSLGGLFAQARNLVSKRFWSMLKDLNRFYGQGPKDIAALGDTTLGEYLDGIGCGAAFRDDHLYPMAAAIWSTPVSDIPDYPAASFLRFCENHGLLQFTRRPRWRTVAGGSREYVSRLIDGFAERVRIGCAAEKVLRTPTGVVVLSAGRAESFDHVVIATHADEALELLSDPSSEEQALLGAFRYRKNLAVLHSDERLMPRRRRVWSSWNYASKRALDGTHLSVTYWMNRLQGIARDKPLFVTLNPISRPDPAKVHREIAYDHPIFDSAAVRAQPHLWSLQGVRSTWFCGAYFGAGFHEDGLQAGLAVAEQLGGVLRPWQVERESTRIHVSPAHLNPARSSALVGG